MIFRAGENVWKNVRASRAAVLVDGASYFGAVRAAMLNARHTIFIAGWDIHSRTRLVGESGEADDGFPETFAEFISALVERRPELNICLLLWDYSLFYAFERDVFPTLTLRWNTPRHIKFCLDDCVPIGSSQHQKLVVVDGALAFNGGLDLTIRRWDTCEHRIENPYRVDPAGKPYPPFHDVQLAVNGEAARVLDELFRERWQCAALETLEVPAEPVSDPWPEVLAPDFKELDIGIARTLPRYNGSGEVREVERLFLDMIDAAERLIYIENQYLTSMRVAQRLAERLRACPDLEVLIVNPDTPHSWLETQSMVTGRVRFTNVLCEAAGPDRVFLAYPRVSDGKRSTSTMVHSKVMVVDDAYLRVGSANLNNRSMGTDTECDLVIAADNEALRKAIVDVRNRLLGEHCGVDAETVARSGERTGSLIASARELSGNGHELAPIDDSSVERSELAQPLVSIADSERPIGAEEFVDSMFGGYVTHRNRATIVKVCAAGLLLIVLAIVWHYTPLASSDQAREWFALVAKQPWAPLIVLSIFVAGGLIMFPVTVLIAATAAAFGPWLGFSYALAGAILSAVATYAVGAAVGRKTLQDFLGPRLNRVRQRIVRKGIIAVVTLRLVPIAPFTVVNLVAGASQVRFLDYALGSLIGLIPGIATLSLLGHQLSRIMTSPTTTDLLLLAGAVILWILLAVGLQALVTRYWGDTE